MAEYEETAVHKDSDWLAMYIVIGVIPLVFFCSALYSAWRDRIRRRRMEDSLLGTGTGTGAGMDIDMEIIATKD
ncbi:hypothetical protein GGS20DRAFT_565273 [Poronia punctata]|nr:hypothetical protein GGS20DRAFT_565273 [Poronia punctata]